MELNNGIDWSGVFEKYPTICRSLYKWFNSLITDIKSEDDLTLDEFLMFIHMSDFGISKFPITTFQFFDKYMICYVMPYSDWELDDNDDSKKESYKEMKCIRKYKSFVQTNKETIQCFDYTNINECINNTVMNCFKLMNDIYL